MVVPLYKDGLGSFEAACKRLLRALPALCMLGLCVQPASLKFFPSLLTGRKLGDAAVRRLSQGLDCPGQGCMSTPGRAESPRWPSSVQSDILQLLPWGGGGRNAPLGAELLSSCIGGEVCWVQGASCLNSYRVCRIG